MTQQFDDDFHEVGHVEFVPEFGDELEFLPEDCEVPDVFPLLVAQRNNYEELRALQGIVRTANYEYEKASDPIGKDTWFKRMNQASKDLLEATEEIIRAERDEWTYYRKKKT